MHGVWLKEVWMQQKLQKKMSFTLNFLTLSESYNTIGNTFGGKQCFVTAMTPMKATSSSTLLCDLIS